MATNTDGEEEIDPVSGSLKNSFCEVDKLDIISRGRLTSKLACLNPGKGFFASSYRQLPTVIAGGSDVMLRVTSGKVTQLNSDKVSCFSKVITVFTFNA